MLVFLTGFLTNLTNKYNHKEHAGRPSVAAKAWLNVQEHRLTIITHVWHQIFKISKGFFETLIFSYLEIYFIILVSSALCSLYLI